MQNCASRLSTRIGYGLGLPSLAFLLSLSFLEAACGAPGEPVPPSPPIPAAITDLDAHQAGDAVQLAFTLPVKTVRGDRLTDTPSIEILRGTLKPDRSPDPKSFRVVYTIPGALTKNYRIDEHVQVVDPVASTETSVLGGTTIAYRVRTRVSQKRASSDSNTVTVKLFAVPEHIASLQAKLTQTAVELNWTPPAKTSAGNSLTNILEYHVYRGELRGESGAKAAEGAARDVPRDEWVSPPIFLARSDTTNFRDTQFDFGKTYAYAVRTAIAVDGNTLESDDSNAVVVAALDTFPPAAPQGLVAAVSAAAPNGPGVVDLSWSMNTESDLAGYRIYRSEQEGDRGEPLTRELLLSPTYRDTSVEAGRHYWYHVSAVDRSGNESAPSAPVVADIAQPSS